MQIKRLILVVLCFSFAVYGADAGMAAQESTKKKKVRWVKSKYGLKALIQFANDRGAMVRELRAETKNYKKVRSAVDKGNLKKGESADRVRKSYGDPVIILTDKKDEGEKWVYKSSDVDYSTDKKVYLIFDGDLKLTGWETPGSVRPMESGS